MYIIVFCFVMADVYFLANVIINACNHQHLDDS